MDVKFHSNPPAVTVPHNSSALGTSLVAVVMEGGAYTACQDSSSKVSPINGAMPRGSWQNQREPHRQKRQRRTRLTRGVWDSAKHSAKGRAVSYSTYGMDLDVRCRLFS